MEEFFNFVKISVQRALLYEALLTPKPGLVDRHDSGSHLDMDIYSFGDSTLVLGDYFKETSQVGYNNPKDKIMDIIRPMGIESEKEMYKITNGVNVHKGVIFLYGIMSASLGYLKGKSVDFNIDIILETARQIGGNLLEDFKSIDIENPSYGESQYLKYGSTGIRGEVVEGFPSVKAGWKVFNLSMKNYNNIHIALGDTLLYMMTIVFDSNIVGRGGIQALDFMKDSAKEIIKLGGYHSQEGIDAIKELNKVFIEKNISPGGCADLSSLVLFLYFLRDY